MGTRLNKVMGYGLADVKVSPTDRLTLVDERINADVVNAIITRQEKFNDIAYTAYLDDLTKDVTVESILAEEDEYLLDVLFEKNILESSLSKSPLPKTSVTIMNGIVYQPEYADPHTLVIIPPGYLKNWSRHDDDIDYLELRLDNEDPDYSPVTKVTDYPFFPFETWMDSRTGKRLTPSQNMTARAIRQLHQASNVFKSGEEKATMIDFMSSKFDVESYEEFKKVVVPEVPASIKNLTDWLGLFTSDTVYRELRPVYYRYWS